MPIFADIPYWLEAFFAACRISLWFLLLFGLIAPLFLEHTRQLPGIEKLVYSWVGLGGVILASVFVLTVLHIYDFISLVLTLLLIPLVRNIWKSKQGVRDYLLAFERRAVLWQLRFVENFREWSRQARWMPWKQEGKEDGEEERGFAITRFVLVVVIAVTGGLIRMYPALQHAAPFSRNWYIQLDRIKNLRLQDYFSGYPEPAGMHSLVSVFSMLTQVSPEMILHLLGALSSFFLCILIYWFIRDITRNEVPMAPILGMSVYAVVPLLLMPLSLDLQVLGNDVDLALCFAIPTLGIFVRNIRARYKGPWFYVLSGFVATGLTNLFVAFVLLLPLLFVSLLSLPRRRYWQSFLRLTTYLLVVSLAILAPFIIYNAVSGIDQYRFFIEQLIDAQAYTYNPHMLLPVQTLSWIFLGIAGVLGSGYLLEMGLDRGKGRGFRDEFIFILFFGLLAMLYTTDISRQFYWIDTAQVDNFYSVMIALFIGTTFASVLRWLQRLIRLSHFNFRMTGIALSGLLLAGGLLVQGGVRFSRQLPATIPDGFNRSYYRIIDEYLPYSYATVGPEITRIPAKNRHYFMNYDFFLTQYGRIDSLYQQQLNAPGSANTSGIIPPASIFVFMEKPPYQGIQQGILYNSSAVMRDLQQWFLTFSALEGRTVSTYYEDEESIVYRIINRTGQARVEDILWNTRPAESTNRSRD